LDLQDTRLQAALRSFAAAMTSVERHIFRLHKDKLECEPPSLELERRQLLRAPEKETFDSVARRIESELSATAGLIRTRLAGAVELSEIVMLLAGATHTIETGSHARERSLQEVNSQLEAGLKLQSVDEFRSHIRTQVTSLTRVVEEMHEQNMLLLEDLQREMKNYRSQLDRAAFDANRDPLTGLSNRRTLEIRLGELIGAGIGYCLILIDFNRFKFINDQYGHLAGDELLRSFASRLMAQVREDDTAVRWGGDEFVVLLPVNLPEAMSRSRILERHLSGDYRIEAEGRSVRVPLTFTMAIAEYRRGETAEQVIARADAMLYSAKAVKA
jgi:diguanylate cyclase